MIAFRSTKPDMYETRPSGGFAPFTNHYISANLERKKEGFEVAVVKAPALSLDASGNLGGICYSKWRGLSIARDTWTGTVPNTSAQVEIQDIMTDVSQAWSGLLTEDQRQKWRKAAEGEIRISRVKTTYIPTGYQYYMQLNMQRMRKLTSILEEPPPAMEPFGFGGIHTDYFIASQEIRVRGIELFKVQPERYWGESWVTRGFDNEGRRPIDPDYRFDRFIAIILNYSHVNTEVGKWHWVRMRWWHETGRVGNWFEKQQFAG